MKDAYHITARNAVYTDGTSSVRKGNDEKRLDCAESFNSTCNTPNKLTDICLHYYLIITSYVISKVFKILKCLSDLCRIMLLKTLFAANCRGVISALVTNLLLSPGALGATAGKDMVDGELGVEAEEEDKGMRR